MSEENGEATKITTPWGSITGKRTAELISILLLCGLAVMAYAFHGHKEDVRENGKEIVNAIREFTSAQRDSNREQRITNCLISLEPQERKEALTRCERLAR